MTKQILFFVMVIVLLIPLSAFAQESLTCPKGAYHGLDNAGNDACRDIKTNKIVQGITTQNNQNKPSQQTDPCVNPLAPGCVSLPSQNFEEIIVIFGIVGTIIVLIVIISKSKRKEHKEKIATDDSTHYYPNVELDAKTDTGERMMWTCSMCKQKFSDKHSYMNHGCHFK